MELGDRKYLAVTIDTEEDNWSNYDSEPVLSNIPRIPELQAIFDRHGVKPTYLVSYPVAADRPSASILRKIMEDGRCEIGAHLHPWNTPPFEEERSVRNTMLFHLNKDLQYRKMESLHSMIRGNFGIEPSSFRTGRWGFDATVAENLCRMGYRTDTSVSPYISWERCHGPDFSNRTPMPGIIRVRGKGDPDASLLEVPATIGFLQGNFERCNSCLNAISNSALKKLRLRGILDKLGIVNKVWLSPESDTDGMMIRLSERILRNGYPILNMFFHSPSLQHGLTHFTKTKEEEKELFGRIERYMAFKEKANLVPVTISGYRDLGGHDQPYE